MPHAIYKTDLKVEAIKQAQVKTEGKGVSFPEHTRSSEEMGPGEELPCAEPRIYCPSHCLEHSESQQYRPCIIVPIPVRSLQQLLPLLPPQGGQRRIGSSGASGTVAAAGAGDLTCCFLSWLISSWMVRTRRHCHPSTPPTACRRRARSSPTGAPAPACAPPRSRTPSHRHRVLHRPHPQINF
uniref:Uncharacterized protein n=1 Tax=Ananas comosus var. bracteatus TaxID=296719 RepID=A0A6V7QD11_ANACO|nr:unnamed protein product [Ananas comosus var. bracteatus]